MVICLLQERTASPSAYTRATMVIAIKYTIVERPQPIDSHIKSCIATFLLLIKDEDRVRDSYFHLAVFELHNSFHSKVHWPSAGHKYFDDFYHFAQRTARVQLDSLRRSRILE